VTATNAGGTPSATSAPTAPVAALPPASVSPPTIAGTALEGETLIASAGSWTGSTPLVFEYRWQRCDATDACVDVVSSAGATYGVGPADAGSAIRVVVTATNAGGSSASTPTAVVPVSAPAPETSIESGPEPSTSATAATFTFSSTGPADPFACSLDGAAFTTCSSPVTYDDLPAGSHAFEVRAEGDPTPATWTWTIGPLSDPGTAHGATPQ